MSKYTKQWMKLLKAEVQHKRKAIQKRTNKIMGIILNDKQRKEDNSTI